MSVKKLVDQGGKPEFEELELLIKPDLPSIDEIYDDLSKVHQSIFITNGYYNRLLEQKFCELFDVKYCLTVNNATIGLMVALKATIEQEKGEVITSAFTFPATGYSILWSGYTPVFADIDAKTKNLSVKEVEKKITSNTVALMPVYIFSNPPDHLGFEKIAQDYHLKLLYDTAQGIGSEYHNKFASSFGDVEVFSLAPTKVVTAVEGGLITTNNYDIYKKAIALRDAGKTGEYEYSYNGLNARMTEYQAIVGLYNLKKIQDYCDHRLKAVTLYKKYLSDLEGISFQAEQKEAKLTYNYMVIFIQENLFGMSRDQLNLLLSKEGVQTKKYFYPALHQLDPFSNFPSFGLTQTELAVNQGLALPLYNNIPLEIVERVSQLIIKIKKNI